MEVALGGYSPIAYVIIMAHSVRIRKFKPHELGHITIGATLMLSQSGTYRFID